MTFLYLNSDQIGKGDEKLGKMLLIAFLKELYESGEPVDVIGCMQTAVYLTSEEGEALEILKNFAARGTEIASCGRCLEQYGKKDSLKVGKPGNMKKAVEIFTTADKIISPC